MDERFFGPMCFIKIEGILLRLPIEGNQSFLVFAVFTALISTIGTEVEQVPDVSRPQIRTLLDHVYHMFVINALIFFGVISLFGVLAMQVGVRIGTVFAKPHGTSGMFRMILIEKFFIFVEFTQIPTVIKVVAIHVGNIQNRAIRAKHKNVCHRRGTSVIEFMAQIVQ